jgi:hypothetical protein
MLNFLPAPLLGVIAFLLLALNVLFWVPVLLVFAVVRLILPFKRVRLIIDPLLVRIAEAWISGNSGWMDADPAHRLGCRRHRRARSAGLVPGQQQPPELGRHLRPAAPVQPAHPAAQVLHQGPVEVGAGHGPGLVGAGLSLHAPPQRGIPQAASRDARQGPGGHAQGLREVRPDPHQRDELPRGHALHAGQACEAATRPIATCSSPRPAASRWRSTPWATSSAPSSTSPSCTPTARRVPRFPLRPLRRVIVRVQSLPVPAHLMNSDYAADRGDARGLRRMGQAAVARQGRADLASAGPGAPLIRGRPRIRVS